MLKKDVFNTYLVNRLREIHPYEKIIQKTVVFDLFKQYRIPKILWMVLIWEMSEQGLIKDNGNKQIEIIYDGKMITNNMYRNKRIEVGKKGRICKRNEKLYTNDPYGNKIDKEKLSGFAETTIFE